VPTFPELVKFCILINFHHTRCRLKNHITVSWRLENSQASRHHNLQVELPIQSSRRGCSCASFHTGRIECGSSVGLLKLASLISSSAQPLFILHIFICSSFLRFLFLFQSMLFRRACVTIAAEISPGF
jgi:hypothetical protein